MRFAYKAAQATAHTSQAAAEQAIAVAQNMIMAQKSAQQVIFQLFSVVREIQRGG